MVRTWVMLVKPGNTVVEAGQYCGNSKVSDAVVLNASEIGLNTVRVVQGSV
jgi:hypothetical protein